MTNTYAKAYTEVLEILKYLPKEEYNKIPRNKIEFYDKHKDKDYIFRFDETKPLNEQYISREANAVVVTLFRDYFASETQKEKLENILKNNYIKQQEELQIKYNTNDIFKNKQNNENIPKNELIVYKENIFLRIIKRIKNFFGI